MTEDTIFAFASGAGRAAIGVFRLSGPKVRDIVEAMTAPGSPHGEGIVALQPRYAQLVKFIDPRSKDIIDQGLVLWFPSPASFTGEDAAEFHIHGGPAVQAAFVQAFGKMEGLRPAVPGEFTRRAFLNGKLDLSAAEGLADLIDAETEAQRRQAVRLMSGRLRGQVSRWRAVLLEAAALIEGEIDFSDEADVPKAVAGRLRDLLMPLRADLTKELSARAAERIRDGLTIVIAGPPNAGKSTLMNALARRDVAIVSEHAGTTRDTIEVHLDIEGLPITLIDTAGLRESADPVEQIGMSRARERSKDADLVLWLSEAEAPIAPDPALLKTQVWPVFTKADLAQRGSAPDPHPEERAKLASRRMEKPRPSPFEPAAAQPPQGERLSSIEADMGLSISAATGEGVDQLVEKLGAFAISATFNGEAGLITRERHRQAFGAAASALERILADLNRPIEFLAEDLRLATRALESLVGGVDVEDVLGEIFSRFCVGK
ncbi:tRNA uridine-5-carboxymethylaminomethyl(34) synthesis GTPase MnmE [Methyloferula stellata]|uniref:tRNA uridine-5-carboxymethylaminomethyl(34) synthesis GTPase MnmE n=1 Tax=Methyloferula stellata TaxID=876270 RepID=UPI00037FBACF|nr:tRNA uridine-5-carboxymethylaminomethyl(34) synthesis GTPase MnmE [Methyloferula stellata]